MASVAMMVSGALVNALAFTRSSYGFSLLNGGHAEIKRHDLAIEKLAAARNAWVKERQQKIDMINKQLYEEKKSEVKFHDLDAVMSEYKRVFGNTVDIAMPCEPVLSDLYTGPAKMSHETQLVLSGVVAIGVSYMALKYVKPTHH